MVIDVVDRHTQLIVGKSWWTGKRVSDFGVVAQNLRSRRVDQGLNKRFAAGSLIRGARVRAAVISCSIGSGVANVGLKSSGRPIPFNSANSAK